MKRNPCHKKELVALKRIEGQVRGIAKMIEEGKYCVDILTQITASVGALHRVQDNILLKHIDHCVSDAAKGNGKGKAEKLEEIIKLVKRFRKNG